jgi:hypothetical protein
LNVASRLIQRIASRLHRTERALAETSSAAYVEIRTIAKSHEGAIIPRGGSDYSRGVVTFAAWQLLGNERNHHRRYRRQR